MNQAFPTHHHNGRSASSSEIIGRGSRARNGLAYLQKNTGIGRQFANFNIKPSVNSKIPRFKWESMNNIFRGLLSLCV